MKTKTQEKYEKDRRFLYHSLRTLLKKELDFISEKLRRARSEVSKNYYRELLNEWRAVCSFISGMERRNFSKEYTHLIADSRLDHYTAHKDLAKLILINKMRWVK